MDRKRLRRLRLLFIASLLVLLSAFSPLTAQPEYVPLENPVYSFLEYAAARGYLPGWSAGNLPLSRRKIRQSLLHIASLPLSATEQKIVMQYVQEFAVPKEHRRVAVPSSSDSLPLFVKGLFGDDEKFLFYLHNPSSRVVVEGLGSLEYWGWDQPQWRSAILVQGGFRIYGDVQQQLGYFLQITNGTQLAGDRDIPLQDVRMQKNVKFRLLQSDFDFTESHVRFASRWFSIAIGRMRRKFGAGLHTALFTDPSTLPYDALSIGLHTDVVSYSSVIAGLLANPLSSTVVGVAAEIPPKYYIYHRFQYQWSNGAIGVNEGIITSGRPLDIAYLTPLSFLKSIEHSLHDRDNSFLGIDAELQLFPGVRIVGGWLLDDIIFSKIGENFWSNKTAWNFGARLALLPNFALDAEYTRAEPYVLTHFNYQNTPTHDSVILVANIPPNADRWTFQIHWWWGQRFPLILSAEYLRHGRNIVDSSGTVIRNVGGNIWQSRRHEDSETVHFLDGDIERQLRVAIEFRYELFRQWILHCQLLYQKHNGSAETGFGGRIFLRFGDF